MKSIALGLLLLSATASAESRLRLFLGGTVEGGASLTTAGRPMGGVGLVADVGAQIDERFAIYVSARGNTTVLTNQGLGLLMFELSPAKYFSIATGAGVVGVHAWNIEASDRGLIGLAIPLRVSFDFFEPTPERRVGVRLSLEGGVSPVAKVFGPPGYATPLVWGGLMIGAIWR